MTCDHTDDSITHANAEAKDAVYTAFYLPDGLSADGVVVRYGSP
jgi:hypothetical protein